MIGFGRTEALHALTCAIDHTFKGWTAKMNLEKQPAVFLGALFYRRTVICAPLVTVASRFAGVGLRRGLLRLKTPVEGFTLRRNVLQEIRCFEATAELRFE